MERRPLAGLIGQLAYEAGTGDAAGSGKYLPDLDVRAIHALLREAFNLAEEIAAETDSAAIRAKARRIAQIVQI